jgi:geranylgeranyl diphosphate synthase type II
VNPDRAVALRRRLVDRALAHQIPPRADPLSRAMRYSLLSGGKRLRSVLLLAAGEAVGGAPRDLVPFACGIEMIHTYSLVHDDLPAMDDDDLRRGQPTAHRVFGEAMAILAGDALLTEAFRVMADGAARVGAARAIAAVGLLAAAAGMHGMVAGQVDDLRHEGRAASLATVRAIHRRKTAALIEGAARAGGLLGGAPRAVSTALGRYGRALGLALQIADDIRDVEGTTRITGKVTGRDRARGKSTYVRVLGAARARAALRGQIARALRALAPLRGREAVLAHLAHQVADWGNLGASPTRGRRADRRAKPGRRRPLGRRDHVALQR